MKKRRRYPTKPCLPNRPLPWKKIFHRTPYGRAMAALTFSRLTGIGIIESSTIFERGGFQMTITVDRSNKSEDDAHENLPSEFTGRLKRFEELPPNE